jgi:hypothetical protein
MSFRSLTHYFIHMALAGEETDAPAHPEPSAWEKNMERAGDERRLQAIGHQIENLDIEPELMTLRAAERLREVQALLHEARVACWKL